MTKERCVCGKIAVWIYLPGYSNKDSPFWCDDCVPRGCDCNYRYCQVDAYHPPLENPNSPEGEEGIDWKWIEKDKIWTPLDENKNEYPCAEYMWDSEGWEREYDPHLNKTITPNSE